MKTNDQGGHGPKKIDKKIKVQGVGVSVARRERLLDSLSRHLGKKAPKKLITIATPNPEQIIQAQNDDSFRSILNSFSYSVPDGVGLVWAMNRQIKRQTNVILDLANSQDRGSISSESYSLNKIIRITGIDLANDLIRICASSGQKVLFIGGKNGVAEEAGEKLKEGLARNGRLDGDDSGIHDDFEIKGTVGFENVQNQTEKEVSRLVKFIKTYKPALILLGFGAPYQEKWIIDNKKMLEQNGVCVAMVVGGSFDVWSGRIKRAPQLLQTLKLEWLFRLAQEPWRWKRQLRLVEFVVRVFRD